MAFYVNDWLNFDPPRPNFAVQIDKLSKNVQFWLHFDHFAVFLRGMVICYYYRSIMNRPCALLKKNNDNALSLFFKMGNE